MIREFQTLRFCFLTEYELVCTKSIMRCTSLVARMGKMRHTETFGNLGVVCEDVDWIHLAQDRRQ